MQLATAIDSGRCHHARQRAQFAFGLGKGRAKLILVAHVARQCECVAVSVASKLGCGGAHPIAVAIQERHRITRAREETCDR